MGARNLGLNPDDADTRRAPPRRRQRDRAADRRAADAAGDAGDARSLPARDQRRDARPRRRLPARVLDRELRGGLPGGDSRDRRELDRRRALQEKLAEEETRAP